MSEETHQSEQDQVIALMAQEGISRVKATKLLYELAKQKKKDTAKIELNINQGDNSTVKNQIERFSSQRDLSNASNQVHRDIDLQEGRPVLKLDQVESFRYQSTGPHPLVPTEYVAPVPEPYQRPKSMRVSPGQRTQSMSQGQGQGQGQNSPYQYQQGQMSPGQPQRGRADTGSEEEDEVVVPYDEDKPFPDSPPSRRTSHGVAAESAEFQGRDNGGWNGELEDSPGAQAATASMPDPPAPKRRSSNAALNLRPLSRLHPNKFRDSLSPEDQDEQYDEEDSGDSGESDPEQESHPDRPERSQRSQPDRNSYRSGSTASSDDTSPLAGASIEEFGGLTFSHSASPAPTPTRRGPEKGVVPAAAQAYPGSPTDPRDGQVQGQGSLSEGEERWSGSGAGIASVRTHTTSSNSATVTTSSFSSSTTTTTNHFTSSENHRLSQEAPQPSAQQHQSTQPTQHQRRAPLRDDGSDSDSSPVPPRYTAPSLEEVQARQQAFTHGGAGSWSTGAQSQSSSSFPDRGPSAESKSFSQSSANVTQLAMEEKLALLNAGRSSNTSSTTTSGHSALHSPAPHNASFMSPPSATNVKVLGSKKLTIRAASSVGMTLAQEPLDPQQSQQGQEVSPPGQNQGPGQSESQQDSPLPPPSYEESASSSFAAGPTGTSTPPIHRRRPSTSDNNMDVPIHHDPLPDYYSDHEDDDGLTQEQRTAALMAKYKRRSYMRPDNTPEAFRNLDPVDPEQIEEMLRLEQARNSGANAGRFIPPSQQNNSTNTISNTSTTNNIHGTATPPSEIVYITEAPSHNAVEAVMQKESTDLIEELIQQGYSRENALSLAKEIELDRRAGRFGNGAPRSSYDGSVNERERAERDKDTSPQRPGLPRPNSNPGITGGSNSSVASQSSYSNTQAWGNNNNNNNTNYYSNKAAFDRTVLPVEDDVGSVISQISAVSRQSVASFGENDRLLMNLLLSQQKARYGVNMYESLSNSDEPTIERYMGRGMSLDQAVLKVFEKKYGPVDNQAMPRQMTSSSSKSHTLSSTSSVLNNIAYDSAEAQEIVGTMHAEIELLMLSGDYTREVAVKMLLSKVARERAQQALNGGLSIDGSDSQLHRSMSMSGMGSPKGRGNPHNNNNNNSNMNSGASVSGWSEADYRNGGMHSARSMYDSSSSRAGASVVSERSGRSNSRDVPMPHHHPGDHYHNQHQNDYIAQYHAQEYSRGPNGNGGGNGGRGGGDQYIIHHHYSAPSERKEKRRPSTSNQSVLTNKTNNSNVSNSSRTVDDREYLPTLLQEQEQMYGVNMFEYLAPDDPEVSRLMNEFNFSRTDAMIAVFQQFPPVVSTPTPGSIGRGSHTNHHRRNLSGGSSGNVGSPRKPSTNNSNGSSSMNMYSNTNTHPSSAGSHNSGVNGNNFFPTNNHNSHNNNTQYDEDAELERVMRLSMQEVNERPGAVSMPGSGMNNRSGSSGGYGSGSSGSSGSQYNNYNSNNYGSGGSSSDVAALVGMGFTSAQAHEALSRHGGDVHKAANYLLGGA